MASSLAAIALVSLAARSALAQGDPEALTGTMYNQPTSSWTQWQPKPTYALEDVPDQYMGANRIAGGGEVPVGGEPQSGFNRCAVDAWNQDSKCQTAWINDVNDWCIWGPPEGGEIGSTERVAVAYCTTDKHGTRLIPDGTLTSSHFLKTPEYVQVTGTGDFTSIGIPMGDAGGEMDPHGADDLGNPIGGIMFTTANPESNGEPWMVREWTNFMSWNQYCLRACWGDQAAARCEHIYDIMGCRWNMPSESGYTENIWESCDGDNAQLAGIYGGSTFRQGQPVTPEAHPPAASSNCNAVSSLAHNLLAVSGLPHSSPTSTNTAAVSLSTTGSPSTSQGMATSAVASPSGSTPQSTLTADRAAANDNTSGARAAASSSPITVALLSSFALGLLAVLAL